VEIIMQLVRTMSLEMSELRIKLKQIEETRKGKDAQTEMEVGDQSPVSTRKKRKRAVSSSNS